jgi:hypothetical protein
MHIRNVTNVIKEENLQTKIIKFVTFIKLINLLLFRKLRIFKTKEIYT